MLARESRRCSLSALVRALPASTLCPTVFLGSLPLRFVEMFDSLVEVDRAGRRLSGTLYPSSGIVMLFCVCKWWMHSCMLFKCPNECTLVV